jgi:hypothetical protein
MLLMKNYYKREENLQGFVILSSKSTRTGLSQVAGAKGASLASESFSISLATSFSFLLCPVPF